MGYSKIQENEIKISDLVSVITSKWKLIALITSMAVIIGVIIALLTPREYRSYSKLLPLNSEAQGLSGSLGSIASLAGVKLGNSDNGVLDPQIYAEVISSTPFMIELMESEFSFSSLNKRITLEDYAKEHLKKGPTSRIIGIPMQGLALVQSIFSSSKESDNPEETKNSDLDSEFVQLSKSRAGLFNGMRQRLSLSISKKNNVISISYDLQDPKAAAQVVAFTVNYLKSYVTEYNTGKEKKRLEFIETQLRLARIAFNERQQKLADFQDSNINLSLASSRTVEQRLQSEYDLAFNVFNTLAQEYEQSKIRVAEVSPVFKTLEPIAIPNSTSNSKVSIVITFLFIGLFGSIATFLGLSLLKSLKS